MDDVIASLAESDDEFKAALEAYADALAKAIARREARKSAKHLVYATNPISDKIEMFSKWVEREFPMLYPDGLSEHDVRLIQITIRTYQDFQREVNGRDPR